MLKNLTWNIQRLRVDRAVKKVHKVAGDFVQPAELDKLLSGAENDSVRLAIGGETLLLISTGLGLVSTGLGIMIKKLEIDFWLPLVMIFFSGGIACCWWGHWKMACIPKEDHTTLQITILLLGVALLAGFTGAVQKVYHWPSFVSLVLCGVFLFLAHRTDQKAVLAAALTALAAFIGVQKVPNNWTIFQLIADSVRGWIFVGSVLVLATLLAYWKRRPSFARVCMNIAIPIGLVAECAATIKAVDENLVLQAIGRTIIIIAVSTGIVTISRYYRIRFLSVVAVSVTLVAILSLVNLWLGSIDNLIIDEAILFFLFIAISTLFAAYAATKLVKTAPPERLADED